MKDEIGQRIAPITNLDLTKLPSPEPKPSENVTVRRELDQIARQLKGLSDRVKRLKETTA